LSWRRNLVATKNKQQPNQVMHAKKVT